MLSVENYEKDKPDIWYDIPENVSGVLVDPISGKAVTADSQKKKIMYFINGTEPTTTTQVFDEQLSKKSAT